MENPTETTLRISGGPITGQPRVSIVMPAYNEEKNIEATVQRCVKVLKEANFNGEIVVTNDGSKDRTGEVLANLQKSIPQLRVVTHVKNTGYGGALRDAILGSAGAAVATIDSDGQFDIAELPMLMKKFEQGYDVLTGYRKKKKDSLFRVVADRGLNLIVRTMFGVNLRDTNCAFKIFKGDVIRTLNIESWGYQTPTEITLKLHTLGFKVGEEGVSHLPREKGASALHPYKTIVETMLFLIYLRLKITLYRRRVLKGL